ncbi:hypothetical protein G4Y79_05090 [Phototrophicus methaneseepsis]|uniref:Uncharacterized protein n=1 Tax=Phototrophicus methaneseepsis TaxID=2710758 RepID=A0A7S8EB69_9CHLR|nr:hypothetical protein [Phototrophicus methaneseepsis]QPC83755.1 hypothetical protein G4Y79_05090 [Phototrophicus methaneseepsis]
MEHKTNPNTNPNSEPQHTLDDLRPSPKATVLILKALVRLHVYQARKYGIPLDMLQRQIHIASRLGEKDFQAEKSANAPRTTETPRTSGSAGIIDPGATKKLPPVEPGTFASGAALDWPPHFDEGAD